MDDKQFLETWDIHNRINLYLLDAIEPASLRNLSTSKVEMSANSCPHAQREIDVAESSRARTAKG